MTEYVLSQAERGLLVELEANALRAARESFVPFTLQTQGVLALIYRQQNLVGNWKLTDDKTRLVKQEA